MTETEAGEMMRRVLDTIRGPALERILSRDLLNYVLNKLIRKVEEIVSAAWEKTLTAERREFAEELEDMVPYDDLQDQVDEQVERVRQEYEARLARPSPDCAPPACPYQTEVARLKRQHEAAVAKLQAKIDSLHATLFSELQAAADQRPSTSAPGRYSWARRGGGRHKPALA